MAGPFNSALRLSRSLSLSLASQRWARELEPGRPTGAPGAVGHSTLGLRLDLFGSLPFGWRPDGTARVGPRPTEPASF